MKCEVGDKVKVRQDLIYNKFYFDGLPCIPENEVNVTSEMIRLGGRVVTISDRSIHERPNGDKIRTCRIIEDNGLFNWTESMFVGPESMRCSSLL